MPDRRHVLTSVHLAFFLSGAASLICEVVWFKQFGLALGNTTQSASAVVAVFFVGLGLGSVVAGRWADAASRPLRLYGALELALFFTSALTTFALARWDRWIGALQPWLAGGDLVPKLGLAAALLALPTLGMGSTWPVLVRYVVARERELGARVGVLYAVNTLGAAVGCTFVGFVGIGWLGVSGAGWFASAMYAVIGLGALLASLGEAPRPAPAADESPEPIDAAAGWLIAVFAVNGLVAVSYEILWFRLLSTATVNTVYVFATLLAVYLLGLLLGAAAAARYSARTNAPLLATFARVQLGIALAGVVSLAVLGRARTLLVWLGGDLLGVSGAISIAVATAAVLLPACVLLGFGFPLASALTSRRLRGLGGRIGLVYGANTVVGAVGSLLTGFFLLPALGSQATGAVLTVANLALFAVLLARFPELRADRVLRREGALAAVGLVVLHALLGPSYLRDAQTNVIGADVLAFRETADGTYLLVEYREGDTAYQQVIVNGTSYANNRPPGRAYMALLAHLPILLHDAPDEVLVICVGTGTTVGAASIQSRVRQVTAVDLSPEIFELAPFFEPWNHGFYRSDRVRRVVADGRHHLLMDAGTFDVLTFEPPPPIEAGVANLYSVEFYELARKRMRPRGLVTQWIPFHQGFQGLERQLVRAELAVFPHVSLWMADNQEGILIGSDQPLRIDPAALAARMAEPAVAAELGQLGIRTPEDVLALLVLADDDLRAWVGPGPAVTDDRPTVERFLGEVNDRFSIEPLIARRTPLSSVLTQPVDDAALALSHRKIEAMWRGADLAVAGEYRAAAEAYRVALEADPGDPYLRYRVDEMAAR